MSSSKNNIRTIVDVEFHSGLISYSRLVTSVLQKNKELTSKGYLCIWDKDYYLDPGDVPKKGLGLKGYINLYDKIKTIIRKDCILYDINIFPKSMKARITGEMKDFRYYDYLKNEMEEFVDITGITMYLNMTSEPYIIK